MVKTRTISKSCPKCETLVPVASKSCTKCKFQFNATKKNLRPRTNTMNRELKSISKADEEDEGRRRTGRVRREKPNFYDSQQFEKKKKKPKKVRQLVDHEEKKETAASRLQRRLKKKEDEGEGHMLPSFSEDKQNLAALLLAEINRKIGIVQWKPI